MNKQKISKERKLATILSIFIILVISYMPAVEGRDAPLLIHIDQAGISIKNETTESVLKTTTHTPPEGGTFIKGTTPRATLAKDDLKYYGSFVTACVVDTGIDITHFAFYYAPTEHYATQTTPPTRILWATDLAKNKDATDNFGTGTMAAGIATGYDIVSPPMAGGTYVGVAPAANVIVARVFDDGNFTLGGPVFGYYVLNFNWSTIRKGFEWCLNNADKYRVKVISFAHGTPDIYDENSCPTYANDLIEKANAKNIPVVVPSGDNSSPNLLPYPACNPKTISVGASFFSGKEGWHTCPQEEVGKDKIACFTNRGKNTRLLAPGVQIYSTVPMPWSQTGRNPYGRAVLTGTPIASSMVVGNILLINQYLSETGKTATSAQIEEALKTTGTPIYDPKTGLTFPRIDVYRAIYSYFHTIDINHPELDAYVEKGRNYWESKLDVSGNNGFSITISWLLDHKLDLEVTDPNGLKYTKETVDADFKYEGPHPIKMTFFKPKKGIWTAKIIGKDIEGVKDFKIKAEKVKKSGLPKPPAGINFTNFDITYLNTCQNTGDLKVVFRGVPSQQPTAAQIKEFENKKLERGI